MTAIYRDPTTWELLFMQRTDDGGWLPDTVAMDCWRTAAWRLYQVSDDMYITMPGLRRWPLLPPEEETNILGIIERPWIPDGAAIEGVSEADIPMADALLRLSADDGPDHPPAPGGGAVQTEGAMSREPQTPPQPAAAVSALWAAAALPTEAIHVRHTHHHVWSLLDDVARPALVWDEPFALRALLAPPSPSAAALALRLLASVAAERPEPVPVPATVPTLPKHVAELVARDAEARGATCPITMEPIKAADATVTSCGHVFQAAALKHWLTDHSTCPECRQNVTSGL